MADSRLLGEGLGLQRLDCRGTFLVLDDVRPSQDLSHQHITYGF